MEEELESLARGFFSVFDNRNKRKPEFAMLQSVCAAGAVIAKRTAESIEICSLAEFWRPRQALLTDGSLTDFHEWEVASETTIYGGIATRICRYKKEGLLRGGSYSGSGTKFMHFVLTQEGWKITAVLWEDEDGRPPAKKPQRYGSGATEGMHQDVSTIISAVTARLLAPKNNNYVGHLDEPPSVISRDTSSRPTRSLGVGV